MRTRRCNAALAVQDVCWQVKNELWASLFYVMLNSAFLGENIMRHGSEFQVKVIKVRLFWN